MNISNFKDPTLRLIRLKKLSLSNNHKFKMFQHQFHINTLPALYNIENIQSQRKIIRVHNKAKLQTRTLTIGAIIHYPQKDNFHQVFREITHIIKDFAVNLYCNRKLKILSIVSLERFFGQENDKFFKSLKRIIREIEFIALPDDIDFDRNFCEFLKICYLKGIKFIKFSLKYFSYEYFFKFCKPLEYPFQIKDRSKMLCSLAFELDENTILLDLIEKLSIFMNFKEFNVIINLNDNYEGPQSDLVNNLNSLDKFIGNKNVDIISSDYDYLMSLEQVVDWLTRQYNKKQLHVLGLSLPKFDSRIINLMQPISTFHCLEKLVLNPIYSQYQKFPWEKFINLKKLKITRSYIDYEYYLGADVENIYSMFIGIDELKNIEELDIDWGVFDCCTINHDIYYLFEINKMKSLKCLSLSHGCQESYELLSDFLIKCDLENLECLVLNIFWGEPDPFFHGLDSKGETILKLKKLKKLKMYLDDEPSSQFINYLFKELSEHIYLTKTLECLVLSTNKLKNFSLDLKKFINLRKLKLLFDRCVISETTLKKIARDISNLKFLWKFKITYSQCEFTHDLNSSRLLLSKVISSINKQYFNQIKINFEENFLKEEQSQEDLEINDFFD